MTEEHKRKLVEGRRNAALARANARKPADIPAGHTRNEAMRMAKDDLEEQGEKLVNESQIGAIDPNKLNRKDNEIQRHIVRRGPNTGSIPVENEQPGYHYIRMPTVDQFSDYSARAAVRKMIEDAKAWGYELISGNMPEDKRFEGQDAAGPTTARGVGDVCTWRITEENYQIMTEYYRNQQERAGQVEERISTLAAQYGVSAVGGDVSKNEYLKRVFGAADAQPVTVRSNFTEGDMRRGSIPGVPAPGVR